MNPRVAASSPTRRLHDLIANEAGRPSLVSRFRMLHAIIASASCASECRARSRSPMIDLYRKKAFSTRACRWYPDSFFHRRRPISCTRVIERSRAPDRGPPGGDRLRGDPDGDVASSDQRAIVGGPARDMIFRIVRGMNSRLHPFSLVVRSVCACKLSEYLALTPSSRNDSCINAPLTRQDLRKPRSRLDPGVALFIRNDAIQDVRPL